VFIPRRHITEIRKNFAAPAGVEGQIVKNVVQLKGPASRVTVVVNGLYDQIRRMNARTGGAVDSVQCAVCTGEDLHFNEVLPLRCGHAICCANCIGPMMHFAVSNNAFPIACPQCNVPLRICEVKEALSLAAIETSAAARASLRAYISSNADRVRQCPALDCCGYFDRTPAQSVSHCRVCSTAFCGNCTRPSHAEVSCAELDRRERLAVETNANEAKFNEMLKTLGGKPCPRCKHYVCKESGCNAMKCICGCGFCFLCGLDCGSDAFPHFAQRVPSGGAQNPCYSKLFEGVYN
jgi:hypothetical protein